MKWFQKKPRIQVYSDSGILWRAKCSCGWRARFSLYGRYEENGEYSWCDSRSEAQDAARQHMAESHPPPLLDKKEIRETYCVD